ncbi:MAG: hypothetical protein SOX43_08915, partial [Pelistega sp.]|nr:hypothetical protein [Pelistega sp.]
SERFKVRRIEQFIGQTIETDVIPGLEPTPKPVKTKDSKGRGKSGGRDRKPSREKEHARSGFARRKGADTEYFDRSDEREFTREEHRTPKEERRSSREDRNPFGEKPRKARKEERPTSRLDFVETLDGDFEVLSAREAKSIKKRLGKEEQPKFADFERGARSAKPKYNREEKAPRKAAAKPSSSRGRKAASDERPARSRSAERSAKPAARSTKRKSASRQWA